MSPAHSGTRKMRGFGFPGCARAVIVPTSAKPNPSASHAGSATAFLSKPAASPTGLGNVTPKTVRASRGSGFGANFASTGPATFSAAIAP